jgi:crotonobetaine/carnitine-CoA ligase
VTRVVVEQATAVDDGRAHVATLRTETGAVVVGRLGREYPPGTELDVTSDAFAVEGAYLPAEDGLLPEQRASLREMWPETCTLPRLLSRQAAEHGDRPLVVCGDGTWSFRETADRAARAAGALREHGIEAGDRVAVLCGNRLELLETVLGCAWIGAIAVPLNTALRGNGLRHTLTDSGAEVLVVEPGLVPALLNVDIPEALREVWVLGEVPDVALSGPAAVRTHPGLGPAVPTADPAPDATLAIMYTSGTTGLPKGVCCPHAQFFWLGVTVVEGMEIDENDVLYTCLPLFHVNALSAFFQALVTGATLVLTERFSVSRFWSDAIDCGATVTYVLGAMVQLLLGAEPTELDARHRVRIALAPATPAPSHRRFMDRFGVRLIEGYASTETNFMIGAHPARQRPGWMGIQLPDFEVRVVDATGIDVPAGVAGELVCRSRLPYAFATGYFGNPGATVRAWRDLWFHSGDRVVRDAAGWLRFLDRSDDGIRRRGENISSLEVEQVLGEHPAVAAVAVYAVPSELAEDEVMAAVVPTPDRQAGPLDLVRWCEPRLSYFAIPRYLDFVDELPMTENGKVRKAVLRERGVTESTWDREAAGYRPRSHT